MTYCVKEKFVYKKESSKVTLEVGDYVYLSPETALPYVELGQIEAVPSEKRFPIFSEKIGKHIYLLDDTEDKTPYLNDGVGVYKRREVKILKYKPVELLKKINLVKQIFKDSEVVMVKRK